MGAVKGMKTMDREGVKTEYLPPCVVVTETDDVLLTSIGVSDAGVGDTYFWEIFLK